MRILLVLIVGIAVGAYGLYLYEHRPVTESAAKSTAESARDTANRAVAKTREVASDVADAFSAKMKQWRLTPDDIRSDLSKSGQVVRENSAKLREKVSDARIVTVIKAKYVLEKDLPANAVSIESTDGRVTLSGTLASETLVAKAVALALDTDGVQNVTSRIRVGGTPAATK